LNHTIIVEVGAAIDATNEKLSQFVNARMCLEQEGQETISIFHYYLFDQLSQIVNTGRCMLLYMIAATSSKCGLDVMFRLAMNIT